jgi:hypothetical protein
MDANQTNAVTPLPRSREGDVLDGSKLWRIVAERTHEAWLTLRDPEGWFTAGVKFDGCISFTRYFNIPEGSDDPRADEGDLVDTLHICDLDEMIERLHAIKAFARAHFGEWPG